MYMPEGPSIIILKEETQLFLGKKVINVSGNAQQDLQRIKGQVIVELKTWGKHFLVCFKDFYIRVHLFLFGSYRINEKREFNPRLSLQFKNGELNFYNASIKIVDGIPEDTYDWEIDTMSDKWNSNKVRKILDTMNETMVCDVLLDQNVFAGSGNIIKNEVLFKIYIHPESMLSALSNNDKNNLVQVVREYCFDFYRWKKAYELRKHWLIYRARICPRCKIPVSIKVAGKTKRKTYFCSSCQLLKR